MAPAIFSPCIWKWQPKWMRRWLRTGKRTPTEFLYSYVSIFDLVLHADSLVIDWSILSCRCIVDFHIDPGHPTEPSGHLELLPREYLSGNDQSEWTQRLEFPPFFPTAILPTKPCGLGERTLVLEPRDQPYVCLACHVTAAMGTTISQDHSVTIQST